VAVHVGRTAFAMVEDEFRPPEPVGAWVPATGDAAIAPVTATSSVDWTVTFARGVGSTTVMLELWPGEGDVTRVAANVQAPANARTVIKVAA